MNPGLLGSLHVTSENSRKYTASYSVYSAYKQSLGYIQIHIHRPSHSNFVAPVWKALKQMVPEFMYLTQRRVPAAFTKRHFTVLFQAQF